MTRIAILDDYQHAALSAADWSRVRARAELAVFHDHLADEEALVERLAPFEALCVMRERTPLTASLLARLPALRFVASTGPRNAGIDLVAAERHGIVVSSTGGRGNGAPELTWALILAAARGLPAELGAVRSGGWQVGIGGDLEGRTLAIMGLGKIGGRMARVAGAFGMRVIAWSPNLTRDAAEAAGATLVDKPTLLGEADILTLHLVLSERSRGIVDASALALMRPEAWLVNTARGPLVDEAALIATLRAGRLAGAALDVFDTEPLPADHPFRLLPNVIATPHLGYVTQATYRGFFDETVENLLAWLDGSPIRVMRR